MPSKSAHMYANASLNIRIHTTRERILTCIHCVMYIYTGILTCTRVGNVMVLWVSKRAYIYIYIYIYTYATQIYACRLIHAQCVASRHYIRIYTVSNTHRYTITHAYVGGLTISGVSLCNTYVQHPQIHIHTHAHAHVAKKHIP